VHRESLIEPLVQRGLLPPALELLRDLRMVGRVTQGVFVGLDRARDVAGAVQHLAEHQ
jgi:hypothetical protein